MHSLARAGHSAQSGTSWPQCTVWHELATVHSLVWAGCTKSDRQGTAKQSLAVRTLRPPDAMSVVKTSPTDLDLMILLTQLSSLAQTMTLIKTNEHQQNNDDEDKE